MIGAPARTRLLPLLRELNRLKRVRPAPTGRSLAERSFLHAWEQLAAGRPAEAVAGDELAAALAATRLAGADVGLLVDAGLSATEAAELVAGTVRTAIATTGDWAPALEAFVTGSVAAPTPAEARPPEFAVLLARQPRAPATRPGLTPVDVEPAENHAEHCASVALIGAVMAVVEGADPGVVVLAGLGHHLHNARLPDGGFAGEEALGMHLPRIVAGLRAAALAELPPAVAGRVEAAAAATVDAGTAEGRAFHAADVVDRLLQAHHHADAAAFSVEQAVQQHGLVHEGPLQQFHHVVLDEVGL